MKRRDALNHLKSLSLVDLRLEISQIENKMQAQQMAIAFGKSKEVRTLRNLKRQMARTLTIANQKMREAVTE